MSSFCHLANEFMLPKNNSVRQFQNETHLQTHKPTQIYNYWVVF